MLGRGSHDTMLFCVLKILGVYLGCVLVALSFSFSKHNIPFFFSCLDLSAVRDISTAT